MYLTVLYDCSLINGEYFVSLSRSAKNKSKYLTDHLLYEIPCKVIDTSIMKEIIFQCITQADKERLGIIPKFMDDRLLVLTDERKNIAKKLSKHPKWRIKAAQVHDSNTFATEMHHTFVLFPSKVVCKDSNQNVQADSLNINSAIENFEATAATLCHPSDNDILPLNAARLE